MPMLNYIGLKIGAAEAPVDVKPNLPPETLIRAETSKAQDLKWGEAKTVSAIGSHVTDGGLVSVE